MSRYKEVTLTRARPMPGERRHDFLLWQSRSTGVCGDGSSQRGKLQHVQKTRILALAAPASSPCRSRPVPSTAAPRRRRHDGAAGADCNVGISMPTRSASSAGSTTASSSRRCSRTPTAPSTCSTPTTRPTSRSARSRTRSPAAPKILVVAAIDGKVLAPVLAEAQTQDATVIAYDRLINGTAERRLLRHLRQLQGRPAAGRVHRGPSSTWPTRPGRSTSSRSPAAPTTTTPSSSSPARGTCCCPTSRAATLVVPSGKSPASNDDWASIGIQGWASRQGTVRDGQPALVVLHRRRQGRRRALPERQPGHRHRGLAEVRRLHRRAPTTRSSPARTPTRPTSRRSSPASSP